MVGGVGGPPHPPLEEDAEGWEDGLEEEVEDDSWDALRDVGDGSGKGFW